MTYTLVILKVESRENNAVNVQNILTNHGCSIKVRLGLHDLPTNACSPTGLIILEVLGDEIDEMVKSLSQVEGVTVKKVPI